MCRTSTESRGLEPEATPEEIEAAARQYIRKVTGITRPKPELAERLEAAALEVAAITERVLAELPGAGNRRRACRHCAAEVRARMGLEPLAG